ncbi:MAG: hypothetical protein ABW065_01705 [Solirubrobacterales bacterium]
MSEFDVNGSWDIHQGNGYSVTFEIDQVEHGRKLFGSASQSDGTEGAGKGQVSGTRFNFRVKWSNGTIGVYNGNFGLDNTLTGITFDEANPGSVASWHSDKVFQSA